jgi:hypothetical protein
MIYEHVRIPDLFVRLLDWILDGYDADEGVPSYELAWDKCGSLFSG